MDYNEFCERYNINLTKAQSKAVQTVEGAVLLLATPGSGKTTVLVARLGYMINALGISPQEILTTTYTVAATKDMSERYRQMFPDCEAVPEFRTINGVSCKINAYYEQTVGRTAPELMSNAGERAALIGNIYRELVGEFANESTVRCIETAITYIKNMMLTEEEINAFKPDDIAIAPIYREYCGRLKQGGRMDYDDQMVFAHKILKSFPDIREHFRKKYRYICVDEAQDTSRIQHEIIRLLAGENGNIFMVGDEDQSIYGFRAAYPKALMDFGKTYEKAKILLIEDNFRSSKQIVDAAQSFISLNKNRFKKNMVSARGEGVQIKEISVADRKAQYRYLLAVAKGCKEKTAVLYRDNDSAIPLIDILNRNGVGYCCRQVESLFFTHRTVRDITDYINFSHNKCDGEIFMRIYYKLGARITKAAAEKAVGVSTSSGQSILHCAAELTDDLPAKTRSMCRILDTHFTRLTGDTAEKALHRILKYMGYEEYIEKRDSDKNRIHVLQLLSAFEPTPDSFLQRLDTLCEIVKSGSSDPDSNFCLSTIHSSKGLEYDNVFLADIADGILPGSVPDPKECTPEEADAFEEERRLFYVGMTRAKNRLNIFTFKDSELSSQFSSCLFPKKQAVKTDAKPQRKKPQADVFVRQVKPGAVTKQVSDMYCENARINHKAFGGGVIIEKKDDIITVRFDSGSTKKLSLSALLSCGLINPA